MKACSFDSLQHVLGLISIGDTWGFGYPFIWAICVGLGNML